jgi:hypothetical protein
MERVEVFSAGLSEINASAEQPTLPDLYGVASHGDRALLTNPFTQQLEPRRVRGFLFPVQQAFVAGTFEAGD